MPWMQPWVKFSKMQPNALLAWQKIYDAKSGCYNKRLVTDLLRGRGRSVGRELDVGEEGYEQMIETMQSLHHGPLDTNMHAHELASQRSLNSCRCNWEHKQEQGRTQLKLHMNV
jgi:hypothetical protein